MAKTKSTKRVRKTAAAKTSKTPSAASADHAGGCRCGSGKCAEREATAVARIREAVEASFTTQHFAEALRSLLCPTSDVETSFWTLHLLAEHVHDGIEELHKFIQDECSDGHWRPRAEREAA